MSNKLVAYSRAGDVFHYRWAARRCLRLVYPNSTLTSVVIEGSKEDEKEGEYVIDVSEYYDLPIDRKQVKYYQLKHTTVQKDTPFTLSDLKDTFVGFSKRFNQHKEAAKTADISFILVTNRPVEDSFKKKIILLAESKGVSKVFLKTIENYTGLISSELSRFCGLIEFKDGEGDYNAQKDDLRFEISQLTAGSVDNSQIENIVSMVQERVLPHSDGIINREDVLKRFEISSERELFPAPAVWEETEKIIEREQHAELIENISVSIHPVLVHAPGGVGKSVFCRQLSSSLPFGSFAVVYDCFGAGQYRNRSEPRHRHRDALVQIINELAVRGLCAPLIVRETSLDSDIMKKFLWSIETAIKNLKKTTSSALLFILIDAADNAEMAALENSTPCFASELLRENLPEGCRLVMLCRTERIELLKPNSKIVQLELQPFSVDESLINLRKWFNEADQKDGAEFHRLTSGNPRVQANALSIKASSVIEVLNGLGPSGMTVEQQIELQLHNAVSAIKDSLSVPFQDQVADVCLGLASLPPHIPVLILAESAGVPVQAVKSFVADIGRSLWLYDQSIQFRDEPTETWFRKTFLAQKENFERYIKVLEPLAGHHTYVAEVLPHLYLQAEQYEKLIETALSDSYLPQDNPIDARNVRVYRLQFAFRASLRLKKYNDAVKIAVRAGEEMAGNQRQLELFQSNIDLLTLLQDKQKIQDIAFKRSLRGGWNGSENAYTASLLSGIDEYKGEARGYLRAAVNWMQIHYQEYRKSSKRDQRNEVNEGDILELAYAFFNIDGVQECVDFLSRFSPKTFTFSIMRKLTERLVDKGNFAAINDFLAASINHLYFTAAIVSELAKVGRFPEKQYIEISLKLLSGSRTRIKKEHNYYHNEGVGTAIISLIEACMYRGFSAPQLLKIIRYYLPEKADVMLYRGSLTQERNLYLKALTAKILLEEKSEVDMDAILPERLADKKEKKDYQRNSEITEFKELVGALFPWYFVRAKIINREKINIAEELKKANEKSVKVRAGGYRPNDNLPNEIGSIKCSILMLYSNGTVQEIENIFDIYIKDNKSLWFPDQLSIVRAAFRLPHLDFLKQELERLAYQRIKGITNDGPQQSADRYIGLARAVLNTSSEDAVVYFEEAVNVVSKFGDEIVRRWEAVVGVAKQACIGENISEQSAYRFIRCAEVVGEYVDREKYWNRNEAVAVCARMSSGTAIAAVSRWRDRDIGRFEEQLEALLTELLRSCKISSPAGWAMSKFFSHMNEDLLSVCLEKESNRELKQRILTDAVRLLQMEGTPEGYWKKIKHTANSHNIKNDILDRILVNHQNNKKIVSQQRTEGTFLELDKKIPDIQWDTVFGDYCILNLEEFGKCLESFYKVSHTNFYRDTALFWKEAFNRVGENDFARFIDVVLSSDIGRYDITSFFRSLPEKIKNKVSFKRKWPGLVMQLGRKFAQELALPFSIKSYVIELDLNNEETDNLKQGIFEGLAEGYDFSDAEMFFGFVNIAVPNIDPGEAAQLTDFTLSRFEMHIEQDFGDGQWSEWLSVPENINNQIAGLIWSALGSPRSSERWNAAHCVRMMTEFNCLEIIEALFKWMQHDKTDAFGSADFPFYNLHARLYLLIASARISLDRPELLIPFKDVFVQYALGEPHALIQKFAADTATNLSLFFDGIYNIQTLEEIKMTGKSKMSVMKLNYNDTVESYWHSRNEISTEHDYYFGYDFDRYWFEPLGDVFGISGKQTEDIAADVMVKRWGIDKENKLDGDPRDNIWNRYSGDRETWHDHSDYPRTDSLDFYLSYHSMMIAAAKLLEKMPIVLKNDWDDNTWDEWISDHLLTCDHGKWLSDYRDAVPLERPEWISDTKNDKWREDISDECFFKALTTVQDNGDTWINVRGGWEEKCDERTEKISIASALVSRNTSDALLRALQTCSDPHDFKLPDYQEERMEVKSHPFELKGWIKKDSASKRLDEYDPYANNVDYPPFLIGDDIASKLNLSAEKDGKFWYLPLSADPDLECETWSSLRIDRDENPDQSGSRLKASIKILKELCLAFKCEIILEVSIKRDISHKYRSREEKYDYSKPLHKLFILSSDGEFRTAAENFRLG